MAKTKRKLGDLLVGVGLITEDQLAEAVLAQKETGERLGSTLISMGMAKEQEIMEALEFQLGIPFVNLEQTLIDPNLQDIVPFQLAERYSIVPVKIEMGVLYIAMEDPFDFIAIDDLKIITGYEIAPLLSYKGSISNAIKMLYGNEAADRAIEEFTRESGFVDSGTDTNNEVDLEVDSAPIVRLVYTMIEQAVGQGASDIHVEPTEREVRIRYRVDGDLYQFQTIPRGAHASVVTRIKILAGINIAEKRVPQDGRFDQSVRGKVYNLRVSTLPTVFGEKVVMRILDKTNFLISKDNLGFSPGNMKRFDSLLKNAYGIILVTGPTGSGKTTTLYTMLSELNKETENIITIEDPVEYMIEGINQAQVNNKAGLTFASALRSFLRQDPDIIMVGEIRDHETAEIALRGAITGHLLLSTLHTNDAVSSIFRLIDMGVEPFMVAVSLVGVISQRLLRKLCPRCAVEYKPSPFELKTLGIQDEDIVVKKAVGCPFCNNLGYKGRTGVHEILVIDSGHKEMIARNAPINELMDYSLNKGMTTLKDGCISLLKQGVTSIEEVLKTTY